MCLKLQMVMRVVSKKHLLGTSLCHNFYAKFNCLSVSFAKLPAFLSKKDHKIKNRTRHQNHPRWLPNLTNHKSTKLAQFFKPMHQVGQKLNHLNLIKLDSLYCPLIRLVQEFLFIFFKNPNFTGIWNPFA